MSKLSLRAIGLDASKKLPVYMPAELPDVAESVDITKALAQMKTGREKEEEAHLQQSLESGTVIPTPEVHNIDDLEYFSELYSQNIKKPKKLICIQRILMEDEFPDYDMDKEDEVWINSQDSRWELTPDKFEMIMDRLEKGSGQGVVTLQQTRALLKEDDDLIMAVYDYWLNKRLNTQLPLIPQVRTEEYRPGVKTDNPYIALRKRPQNKVQTRKNRMKGERSYGIMLKLQRDTTRALSILEMVKWRELNKRELVQLSIEMFEKRYQAGGYSEEIVTESVQQRPASPVVIPIVEEAPLSSLSSEEEEMDKNTSNKSASEGSPVASGSGSLSLIPGLVGAGIDVEAAMSEDDSEEEEDQGPYTFRRKAGVLYQAPLGNPSWPWCAEDESGTGDKRWRYYPTSVVDPLSPTLGFVHFRPKTPEIVSVSDNESISDGEQQASLDLESSSEEDDNSSSNRRFKGKRGCGIQEDSDLQQ